MQVARLKLKMQLLCGDSVALGPGKADLLEAIAREGSISAAGRALGMSYRRAWLLVDEMNRCFSGRLVETRKGGNPVGSALLSALGREMLAAYRALEAAAAALATSADYARLEAGLRNSPNPD